MESIPAVEPLVTLGVIADTHIPDREMKVTAQITETFQSLGVAAILHAGDIITPAVLVQFESIAPVIAVRGNRDWAFGRSLPLTRIYNTAGVQIGIAHGHGGLWGYFLDKFNYLRSGYQVERYRRALDQLFPTAHAIVFGHTHRAENFYDRGKLFFNPGATCAGGPFRTAPSFGLLRIYPNQQIQGEIILLPC